MIALKLRLLYSGADEPQDGSARAPLPERCNDDDGSGRYRAPPPNSGVECYARTVRSPRNYVRSRAIVAMLRMN